MNRGDSGASTVSASGGLYRKDAQAICGNKIDVIYLCGDERPEGHETRQRGPRSRRTKEEGTEPTGGAAAQHSSNRRNWNRIRRQLTRKVYNLERRDDISDERRETEIFRLQEQFKVYQRPPRHKGNSKWEECR